MNEGQIEQDPTLKFHYFDNKSIIYGSNSHNCIKELNVLTSVGNTICPLPTIKALPVNEREDEYE